MIDDLISKSATELIQLIKAREVSSVEIVEAYLGQIEKINPSVNAVVTIAPGVVDRAGERDADLAQGKISGALHGLPITIKDTIDTEGIRTTYGSRSFAQHVPSKDAAVVARLKAAGAIILGKTNTPEMAIPYETDNPVFGRTNNPHDLNRTCGGSSGGEAAAIAAKLSLAGIGSDLSGSIRVPAHFCGIAGLKPTTGTISMEGHVPRAVGTLALGASVGPMARCVQDLALLYYAIAEKQEGGSSPELKEDRVAIAWYTDDGVAPVDHEIVNALATAAAFLREAGFEVRQDVAPGFSEGPRLWIELFSRAASEQMRAIYRGHEDQAGRLVTPLSTTPTRQENIQTAESVAKAVVERERYREELLRWMKNTPLILAPVSATVAFAHGATRVDVNGESVSVFRSCSYSQTANVFGLPAVVVPVGRTAAGLPVGVQIIGRPFEEDRVLGAAAIIEQGAGIC